MRVMLIYKADEGSIDAGLLEKLSKVGRLKLKDDNSKQLLEDSVSPPLPGHGHEDSREKLLTFYNSSAVEVWDGLDIYLLQKEGKTSAGQGMPVYVCMEIGYMVSFSMTIELHDFPFDSHAASLQIMLKFEDSENFDLELFFCEIHSACTNMHEFAMLEPGCLQQSHRQTDVVMNLARRPLFWIHSVVLLSLSLQFLMLLVFLIPFDDVASRVGTSFTLILTMVAFRTYIASAQPKAEYLTMMDDYINIGMLISCVICVGTSLNKDYTGEQADDVLWWISLVAISMVNAFFVRRAKLVIASTPSEIEVAEGKWASFSFGASLEDRLKADEEEDAGGEEPKPKEEEQKKGPEIVVVQKMEISEGEISIAIPESGTEKEIV
jgi:hypothetical protein